MPWIRRDRRRTEQRLGARCRKARGEDGPEREAEGRRDETKRGRLECEDGADLTRREAGRFEKPDLPVLIVGACADEDPNDDESDDQEQDREHRHDRLCGLCIAQRAVSLVLPGLEVERSGLHDRRREAGSRPFDEGRGRGRIVEPERLGPAPLGAIGLDLRERGAGDPGQAGVAAGVARLAGYDRHSEHREVDRAPVVRECDSGSDLDVERTGEAAFEDDAAVPQSGTGGRHRHVHDGAAAQAGEPNAVGTSVRPNDRHGDRNRRVPLADSREPGQCPRIGLGGDGGEHVCPIGRGEGPLPGVEPGRTHLQGEHDRRGRGARDRDRERAREQPRADPRERQLEQSSRPSFRTFQLEQRSDGARCPQFGFVGNQPVAECDHPVCRRGDVRVVGDEQQRLPAIPGSAKESEHVASRRRVEVAGRLVCQNDVGPVCERARQRDALLLAAGQLDRSGSVLFRNAEIAQQLVRRPSGLSASPAHQEQRQLDVLDRRQRRRPG